MKSIILVGGMGTRLAEKRKKISVDKFPWMSQKYHGATGPKGLALLQPQWAATARPLTDWHLKIHARCTAITEISLALGCRADLMIDYYSKDRSLGLKMLSEKNPAGTLAPLIKLYTENKLDNGVYLYANGDNLIDADFAKCYTTGYQAARQAGLATEAFVIDIAALVPWEESAAYGTLEIDFATNKVASFREKGPIEQNSYIETKGIKKSPINSGFSIIVNPKKLFDDYLDKAIIDISLQLEAGTLSYQGNEQLVKYETFYEKLASLNKMVAVLHEGYWTDLGTEEKIATCESRLPQEFFG